MADYHFNIYLVTKTDSMEPILRSAILSSGVEVDINVVRDDFKVWPKGSDTAVIVCDDMIAADDWGHRLLELQRTEESALLVLAANTEKMLARNLKYIKTIDDFWALPAVDPYNEAMIHFYFDKLIKLMMTKAESSGFSIMHKKLLAVLNAMPYAVIVEDENSKIVGANGYFFKYFTKMNYNFNWNINQFMNDFESNYGVDLRFADEFTVVDRVAERILTYITQPVIDDDGANIGAVHIFEDVSLQRFVEQQNELDNVHDALTSLPNRLALKNYMLENCSKSHFAVMTLDIDDFSAINAVYGPYVGDELLIETARVVRENFETDFVSRCGDDEYAIVITREVDKEDLKIEAAQVLGALDDYYQSHSKFKGVSASVGGAILLKPQGSSSDTEKCFIAAMDAMNSAKHINKGNILIVEK